MSKQFYPILILTLIGTFLIFSAWSAYRATTLGSSISDQDYYSKGLKYNTTLVERRAASVLGWQIRSRLTSERLEVRLSDAKNQPVIGAQGQLTVFLPSSRLTSLPFQESSAGVYHLELPQDLRGEIPTRIDFERQGARISRQLLLNY